MTSQKKDERNRSYMGYVYLTLALIGGITKGFAGKKVSKDMNSFIDCMFINTLRALFCTILGLFMVVLLANPYALALEGKDLGICLLSAMGMGAFCIMWMYAYKTEAYMFLSIFTMLGSVLTCLMGFVVYHEQITYAQWLGIILIFLAVYIMSRYNKSLKGGISPKGLLILITGCMGSAVSDFSQKMYMRETDGEAMVFNFYTYGFALIGMIFIGLFAGHFRKSQEITTVLKGKGHVTACFLMALALYVNTTSKTLAAGFLSSAQIYPVLQGANLICSAVLAQILFREKITFNSLLGIFCAFAGLMIMHFV